MTAKEPVAIVSGAKVSGSVQEFQLQSTQMVLMCLTSVIKLIDLSMYRLEGRKALEKMD